MAKSKRTKTDQEPEPEPESESTPDTLKEELSAHKAKLEANIKAHQIEQDKKIDEGLKKLHELAEKAREHVVKVEPSRSIVPDFKASLTAVSRQMRPGDYKQAPPDPQYGEFNCPDCGSHQPLMKPFTSHPQLLFHFPQPDGSVAVGVACLDCRRVYFHIWASSKRDTSYLVAPEHTSPITLPHEPVEVVKDE